MRLLLPLCLSFPLVVAGCASKEPKHVSGSAFEQRFDKSQTVAMQHFFYSGETNGCIYISRITWANWWYYSKFRWQTLYTETNRLSTDFLHYVRQHKPEPSHPPTNWVGKAKAEQLEAPNERH